MDKPFKLPYLLSGPGRYRQVVYILGLVSLMLVVRLINLTLLPPYIDERLHISRAFEVLSEHNLFVYTEGGKFLQIWLIALMLKSGVDPFWGARVVSVMVSLMATLGCFFLARAIFGRNAIGYAAVFFYGVTPFAFFLDRLALNDNLLAMLGIAILLFSYKLIQEKAIWLAAALGVCLGLIGLTKLNGFLFWSVPVFAGLVWSTPAKAPWRLLAGAYFIATVIALPAFFLLPEQLQAPIDKSWLSDTLMPTSLLELSSTNLQQGWLYFQTYLTWPILLIVLLGVSLAGWQRHRGGLALVSIAAGYLIFFSVVGIQIHPRYLFPAVPFLIILAGYAAITVGDWLLPAFRSSSKSLLPGTIVRVSIVVLLAIPAFQFDYQLIFSPTQAPLEPVNRWLFIDGWLSGYGLEELSAYLKEQAGKRGPIVVVRDNSHDLTREGLDLTLADAKDLIELVTIDFKVASPTELTSLLTSEERPIFVVFSGPPVPGAAPFTVDFEHTPYCHEAAKFFKPDQFNHVVVYECGAIHDPDLPDRSDANVEPATADPAEPSG